MNRSDFIAFLVAEIEAGNSAFVDTLLATAKAAILAGGGNISPLTGSSLNGKSFSKTLQMNCAEVASACRAAIIACDEDITNPQITYLNHAQSFNQN